MSEKEEREPLMEEELEWLRAFREGMQLGEPAEPFNADEVRWFRSFRAQIGLVGPDDETAFEGFDPNLTNGGLGKLLEEEEQARKKATQSDEKEGDS